MSLRLSHTTWDAIDPHTVAEFWRELTNWAIHEPDCYHPGSDECYLVTPDGYIVLFFRVPDAPPGGGHGRRPPPRPGLGRHGGPRGQRVLHPLTREGLAPSGARGPRDRESPPPFLQTCPLTTNS